MNAKFIEAAEVLSSKLQNLMLNKLLFQAWKDLAIYNISH